MNYVLCSFQGGYPCSAPSSQEAAALASIALFVGMIAIWAQVVQQPLSVRIPVTAAKRRARNPVLRQASAALLGYPRLAPSSSWGIGGLRPDMTADGAIGRSAPLGKARHSRSAADALAVDSGGSPSPLWVTRSESPRLP